MSPVDERVLLLRGSLCRCFAELLTLTADKPSGALDECLAQVNKAIDLVDGYIVAASASDKSDSR